MNYDCFLQMTQLRTFRKQKGESFVKVCNSQFIYEFYLAFTFLIKVGWPNDSAFMLSKKYLRLFFTRLLKVTIYIHLFISNYISNMQIWLQAPIATLTLLSKIQLYYISFSLSFYQQPTCYFPYLVGNIPTPSYPSNFMNHRKKHIFMYECPNIRLSYIDFIWLHVEE